MPESKKTWLEPELIVLVRSKPEEAVLAGCKGLNMEGGAGAAWGVCSDGFEFCSEVTNS